MGKNKTSKNVKKNKNIKVDIVSDDENEIKKFVIIVLVLVAVIAAVYGLTALFKDKDTDTEDAITAGSINYDITSVGTILNRPYSTYYVLLYNSDKPSAILYSMVLSSYMANSSEDDYIKIYYCDLDNSLNSSYYVVNGESNPDANSVSEFKFGDLTLLKIKNGKIVKYIEDYEAIKKELAV